MTNIEALDVVLDFIPGAILRQLKLDFTFAYPFFQDFQKCGYDSWMIELNGLDYFGLTPLWNIM